MGNSKVLDSYYNTAPFYRKLITMGGGGGHNKIYLKDRFHQIMEFWGPSRSEAQGKYLPCL